MNTADPTQTNPQSAAAQQKAGSSSEAPMTIAHMNQLVSGYIDRLGTVWVEAEITSWKVRRGGHTYGTLRDLTGGASVDSTLWASNRSVNPSEFKEGDRVIALVKPSFWAQAGKYSVNIQALSHVGVGQLMEQLERLRKALAAEGLFAPERKKQLPFLPNLIGLITAAGSDAEKDVKRNALLRWPGVQFRTAYTQVQGKTAAAEVTQAIKDLDADPEVDVIIIARGGGDFLHLLPFSDETLVRTAAAAKTPIVSAIGHENDHPILDDVADLRASTPTDAAKRVVPDVAEELNGIQQARARITARLTQHIQHELQAVQNLRSRPVLASPERMVETRTEDLARLVTRGEELAQRKVKDLQNEVAGIRGRLRALSPLGTLQRGYAIAQLISAAGPGEVLRDPSAAPAGTELRITLEHGALRATSQGR